MELKCTPPLKKRRLAEGLEIMDTPDNQTSKRIGDSAQNMRHSDANQNLTGTNYLHQNDSTTQKTPPESSILTISELAAMDNSSEVELVPVLSDRVTRDLPTRWALVGCIADKKSTAALVAWLARQLPVPDLAHLKRVRSVKPAGGGAVQLYVVIDFLRDVFPESESALCDSDGRLQWPGGSGESCLSKSYSAVSGKASTLVDQSISLTSPALKFSESNLPLAIPHKLEELESVLKSRGTTSLPPGLSEQLYASRVTCSRPLTKHQYNLAAIIWPTSFYRDIRIEASLTGATSAAERRRVACFLARAARAAAGSPGGCVIVDPAKQQVVAEAGDRRGQHALQHAVMRAIDGVAAAQGGGAWTSSASAGTTPAAGRKLPPLEGAERARAGRVPVPENASRVSGVESSEGSAVEYLCTGYEAYVTREPCVMCAMALLHSRIGRVFYAEPRSDGALGSQCKLHVTEGLNHHFQVFRVVRDGTGDGRGNLANVRNGAS